MIYHRKTKKDAYFYFRQNEWFDRNLKDKLHEKAFRTWLAQSTNVITLQEIADSDIGRKSLRAFYVFARGKAWFNETDPRCKLGASLGLMDFLRGELNGFDKRRAALV